MRPMIASLAAAFFLTSSVAALESGAPARTAPIAPAIPAPTEARFPGTISLEVDARDVARGIVSFKQTVPVAKPGTLTLLYPQWLPGNHAPRGAISKLAGITATANGRPVSWRRDPVNVFAFHFDVPANARAITVSAQFLSPTATAQGRVVITPDLANLQWNSLVLYPAGYAAAGIEVKPSLRLPEGWSFASALTPRTGKVGTSAIEFAATDLETFVDSPMFAGAHYRAIALDGGAERPVHLNVFADTPDLIAPTDAQITAHKNLVREADALFASRHFERYDFLFSLSDHLGGIGLEHHQSSENGVGPKYFLDAPTYVNSWDLLPHEYVHSWNGKFRRPADLYTANYDVPMGNSLLWLYEGMTSYWGEVLAARSGMWSRDDAFASLAANVAVYANRRGRDWRSVSDTTLEPVISARQPHPWRSYMRAEDYYIEGLLTWLDADTLIRQQTNGEKSLDDFARAFFGAEDGRVKPLTYDFAEVVETLNAVAPYDWAGFLKDRIEASGRPAPISGVERGGWRLVYKDEPNSVIAAEEKRSKLAFFSYSLGFNVGEGGRLSEVLWGSPAFEQNLRLGDEIVAVNGEAYTAEALKKAVASAKTDRRPLSLMFKSYGKFRTVAFSPREGLRYPHLEKIGGTPDLVSGIYEPKAR